MNPERRDWDKLVLRSLPDDGAIDARVAAIVEQVRDGGDSALKALTAGIDGVELETVQIPADVIADASAKVGDRLKKAIGVASDNIRRFHEAQMPSPVDMETASGVRCVQRGVPVGRVGLYVPGGSAPLFSTVLMLAIPAKVAGCGEIILCTPPSRGGGVAPEILYAASVCGVDKVFCVGGAQAVAAMAYGTQSIPRVDKIFGPGNRYVTKAKQLVSVSQCAIDMPAGPSEVMVLADETAVPEFVAADMLSQAEHGGDSQAVLVTTTRSFAERVVLAVREQSQKLSRSEATQKALGNSRVVVMDDRRDIVYFANAYAAEHLIISMDDPWTVADGITCAGSIFIGNYSPESAGDYASGTNHTLPTAGWARAYSGVNVDSFLKKITVQELTPAGLQAIGGDIVEMAMAEGLDGHANAVKVRLEKL